MFIVFEKVLTFWEPDEWKNHTKKSEILPLYLKALA